jgi:hypothetical protein
MSARVYLWKFFAANWELIVALAAGALGLWRYLDSRKRELAWNRTVFIFAQLRNLDNDADMVKAVAVLSGHDQAGVEDIFASSSSLSDQDRHEYLRCFDKLFNLLDSLAYATFDAKTLELPEVANFGWYIRKSLEYDSIKHYCENNGFRDLVRLGGKIVEFNQARHTDSQVHRGPTKRCS